jgi:lysine 2,3-aminomutase
MSIHFTHPDELTPEVNHACTRLADAGIPLGSQTVLLAGVNDSVETMKHLVHGLLKMRVKPYYLYQCDPIPGSSHFVPLWKKGLEIISWIARIHDGICRTGLWLIDAPAGGGKIPLLPEYVVGRDGDDLLLRNYQGNIYRYRTRAEVSGISRLKEKAVRPFASRPVEIWSRSCEDRNHIRPSGSLPG